MVGVGLRAVCCLRVLLLVFAKARDVWQPFVKSFLGACGSSNTIEPQLSKGASTPCPTTGAPAIVLPNDVLTSCMPLGILKGHVAYFKALLVCVMGCAEFYLKCT